jgi:hypothetical protein
MGIKDMLKDPGINDNTLKQPISPIAKKTLPPKKEEHKGERASKPGERYTENELMVRLKFFIGVCLALTLIGIVFTVLYSIMFVTQPLNAISPIDPMPNPMSSPMSSGPTPGVKPIAKIKPISMD